eukprot:7282616-Pyramimonas_sp.AAC.1
MELPSSESRWRPSIPQPILARERISASTGVQQCAHGAAALARLLTASAWQTSNTRRGTSP